MGTDAVMFVDPGRWMTADEVLKKGIALKQAFTDIIEDEGLLVVSKNPDEDDWRIYHDKIDCFKELPWPVLQVRVRTRCALHYHDISGLTSATIALAEWLDVQLQGCTVWYGGDTDYPLEPFSAERRTALMLEQMEYEDEEPDEEEKSA